VVEDTKGDASPGRVRILPVRLTAGPGPVDDAGPILDAVGRAAGNVPALLALARTAVVTAHASDGGRAAFAVDLRDPGVTCEVPAWVARGLREIPSATVHFNHVPAERLQGSNWYFSRPGFAWGGMGVAACWPGGAGGVARDYRDSLRAMEQGGREADQIALASLGEVDRTLTSALQYLAQVASAIDAGQGVREERTSAWGDALRVRGNCAAAVECVLSVVSGSRGPGPLAFDEGYAKRTADLGLYVGQHHYMRDDAQLGALALKGDAPW
jgi:hypothetical protein